MSKFGQNICFKAPNGQDECWGMQNHMRLFDVAKFASIECEKTRDTDNDGIGDKYDIHESSEVQSSQSFRLCDSKLWELDDYYEVRWEPWVNYQVFDAQGALVEISRPEAVTLSLPVEDKFGRDAGKRKPWNMQASEGFMVLNGQILTFANGKIRVNILIGIMHPKQSVIA